MSDDNNLVCCAPLGKSAVGARDAEGLAAVFKALGDPVRLRLLSIALNAEAGEVCACDLPAALGKSQPTVSHHLKILTQAGLLEREQRGKWAWFKPNTSQIRAVQTALGTS